MEINGLIPSSRLIILLVVAVVQTKCTRGENNLLNYDIDNIPAGGDFADGDSWMG
jgi:hypothetical protein